MQDILKPHVWGHIKIKDLQSGETVLDHYNAINWENFSLSLANTLANEPRGWIEQMVFGNGGATVSGTGVVSYRPPNVVGQSASLYNQTYSKIVNDKDPANPNPLSNFTKVNHITGTTYSDVIITCVLDLGEPSGQDAFDTTTNLNAPYVFNELGLRAATDSGTGLLITHAVFSPVQKSLNRQFEIVYTLRLQMA